jgi:hypothetical protein
MGRGGKEERQVAMKRSSACGRIPGCEWRCDEAL